MVVVGVLLHGSNAVKRPTLPASEVHYPIDGEVVTAQEGFGLVVIWKLDLLQELIVQG